MKGGLDMKTPNLFKQQNTQPEHGFTDALIGSATHAARARDALAAAAIRAQTVKHSTRAYGCIYGIRFPTAQKANAAFVLDRAGITVREYLESTP